MAVVKGTVSRAVTWLSVVAGIRGMYCPRALNLCTPVDPLGFNSYVDHSSELQFLKGIIILGPAIPGQPCSSMGKFFIIPLRLPAIIL